MIVALAIVGLVATGVVAWQVSHRARQQERWRQVNEARMAEAHERAAVNAVRPRSGQVQHLGRWQL